MFLNGQLVQEGDLFDCSTRLTLHQQPGERLDVALRLVSPSHDQGALVASSLVWEGDDPPDPGFVAMELAVLEKYLARFSPCQLTFLETQLARVPWDRRGVKAGFDKALGELRQELAGLAAPLRQWQVSLLGHAHLDLAWLWPVPETWRAAVRTFESVLSLQDSFPELIFTHSSPVLYEWLEEHCPDLFSRIQGAVAEKRWEVAAGLWVEPDLNLIDGESMVRQVTYGQRYVQAKFGRPSPLAWVPDSFGFGAQVPQILHQGKIEVFVTQKLRWNDTTTFPYSLFRWQAPDGTEILGYMSALIGQGVDPEKMVEYLWEWHSQTGSREGLWLVGVGDHGGGPTRDMLETARRWQSSPFFPELEFTSAYSYLGRQVDQAPGPLPRWSGELYLEFHRGCYTTHADQKYYNRYCEGLLYQAELYSSLATLLTGLPYPQAALDLAWKQVLFNQFHDILPGSAIPVVFEEANQTWKVVTESLQQIQSQALGHLGSALAAPAACPAGAGQLVVFNSLPWPCTQVVQIPTDPAGVWDHQGQAVPSYWHAGNLYFLALAVPGLGYRSFWLGPDPVLANPALVEYPHRLENEYLLVEIDPTTGEIASLVDKRQQRQILEGPGNQLQAFRDSGQYWDAWNIDPQYADHPLPAAVLEGLERLDQGNLAQQIQVRRRLGNSLFVQTYRLEQTSPLLQILTQVDWQERHTLVKAAFPLSFEATTAAREVACTTITESPDLDPSRWEVPALRWVDLSDEQGGLSLLNNCKYGYDYQPRQLRLTLLRSPTWPDPEADQGQHHFTYALYPHPGSWQAAQVVRQGYELNRPLTVVTATSEGSLPSDGQFLSLGSPNLVPMAFKQAQDNPDTWILRCYECHGETATLELHTVAGLEITKPVDLLEQPLPSPPELTLSPWQIKSFACEAVDQTQSRIS